MSEVGGGRDAFFRGRAANERVMNTRTCAAVLLVEGDDHLRQRMVDRLRIEGFHVYEASTENQALEVLRGMPRPALVLADLLTPEMDGRILVSSLQSDDRFVIVPVVVSGAGSWVSSEDSRTKEPIDLDDLLRLVESLCFRRI